MAGTVKKVIEVSTQVDDAPGVMAQMTAILRDAGINLKAAGGWTKGGGQATLMCIPDDPAALRALAAREGVAIQEKAVVWVEGADRPGALVEFTSKLAAAGINIVGCKALAVGGNFAAIFSFQNEQVVDRAVALLSG